MLYAFIVWIIALAMATGGFSVYLILYLFFWGIPTILIFYIANLIAGKITHNLQLNSIWHIMQFVVYSILFIAIPMVIRILAENFYGSNMPATRDTITLIKPIIFPTIAAWIVYAVSVYSNATKKPFS